MSNERYQRQSNRRSGRSTRFDNDYEEYSWEQNTEYKYNYDETYCSREHDLYPSYVRLDRNRNYFNENGGTVSDSEFVPKKRESEEYWEFYEDEEFRDSFDTERNRSWNRHRSDRRGKDVSFFKKN